MTDPTEYVEVSYSIRHKVRMPRKTHYPGMTNLEICELEEQPETALEAIILAMQEEQDPSLLLVQVKFISDTDDELEEE